MVTRVRPATTLAITATSVAAAWVACRMFADDAVLGRLLVAALVVHLASLLLRATGVRGWLSTVALLPVGLVVLTLLHYRSTAWGPLPSGSTIDQIIGDLRLVGKQFATAVAPVPSTGPFAAAVTLGVLVVAIAGDTFATRMGGALHAIVPSGALVVLTGAVGTERSSIGLTAAWLATAAASVAVSRAEVSRADTQWIDDERPGVVAIALTVACLSLLAGTSAAALGPRLPGAGEPALIDARHRNGDTTSVLDPLVDIRARMTNTGLVEMFTVQSNDGGHYWRSMGLPEFDGATFSPAAGPLEPLGDRTSQFDGLTRTAQVLRITGLRGRVVPAASIPVAVSPDAVWWAPDTGSLVVPDSELRRGDSVAVTSAIVDPDPVVLDGLSSLNAPDGSLDVPGLPSSVRDLALRITETSPTPYQKLLALQSWFRSEFTYDLSVQIGDGPGAMEVFLRDRRGFCQQFAVTFAAMARSIGIPAQVAVGFTQGDLGADGLFHVFGRHAHAWPEVWFDGVGWVAFEPTPGRGNPDATDWTSVESAQDDTRGQGTGSDGPGNDPGRPSTSTIPSATTLPRDAVPTTTPQGSSGRPGTSGEVTTPDEAHNEMPLAAKVVIVVLAGGVLLAGAWMLLMPLAVSAVAATRRRAPATRVAALWRRARLDLADAGAPTSAALTPTQFAREAELTTGVDHRSLREIARLVTAATYAPGEVTPEAADRVARIAADLRAMAHPGVPLRTRWRNRLDPRAVWVRSAR